MKQSITDNEASAVENELGSSLLPALTTVMILLGLHGYAHGQTFKAYNFRRRLPFTESDKELRHF